MKKIVLEFEDGHKIDVFDKIEEIDLVANFEESYERIKVDKINKFEYKISDNEEFQILNVKTKELYNNTNQSGVIKVSMKLEEEEFNKIFEKIKNKINDSNN
jgi:hypothetical protein